MSSTRSLASYAARLKFEDLPPEVVEAERSIFKMMQGTDS